VIKAFPQTSTYRVDIPNAPSNFCLTFHASQLRRYVPNDRELFPGRELPRDGPVLLSNGQEEHVIERILDERRRGRGWQYLVRWQLPAAERSWSSTYRPSFVFGDGTPADDNLCNAILFYGWG